MLTISDLVGITVAVTIAYVLGQTVTLAIFKPSAIRRKPAPPPAQPPAPRDPGISGVERGNVADAPPKTRGGTWLGGTVRR